VVHSGSAFERIGELREEVPALSDLSRIFLGRRVARVNSSLKNARDQEEKSGSKRMRGRSKSTVFENHAWSLPSGPGTAPAAHSGFHSPLRFNSFRLRQQFLKGKFLQVLGVEPLELGLSNTALVRLKPGERKFLQQISLVRKIPRRPREPAQQREKIAERLREKTFGSGTCLHQWRP